MNLLRPVVLAWLSWDASSFFEWLARRPWYHQILCDWVAGLAIQPGTKGLEIGSGPGLLTADLDRRGATMTGLDRSAAMVDKARVNAPTCTFLEGDALAISMADDVVDFALAASVINLVPDELRLLSEMARVVRPGGRVSVLFPTSGLSDHAGALAKQHGLRGLSAAALGVWAALAPKREAQAIVRLFEEVGLLDVQTNMHFEGTVASVTGTTP